MSNVRRRVLRPAPPATTVDPAVAARLTRQRVRLAKEKAALKRWMTRLKRATNTVTALHQTILRLEASLGELSR
jgi:hypothetical protein